MPDGSEAPVSGFQQKIESRQQVNEQEVGAAQAELAQINPQENRDMLSRLRQSIEGYFTEVQNLSEPVRAKLEELRNSLPTTETVMGTLGTAAGNAKEVGMEMFGETVAATKDVVEDIRQGNFSEIPRKYPVATAVLAFTGLTWLSGKILSWFDGEKRDGFFSNFFKTVATVTGVSFIARMIQKYSAQPEAPVVTDSSEALPEENAPSPSDMPSPAVPATPAAPPASATPAATPPAAAAVSPATPSAPVAPAATPKPTPTAPSALPASISFAEFQRGMEIGGYKVQVTKPDIISVNGQRWQLKHPSAAVTFDDVTWSNNQLTITAGPANSGLRFFNPAETSTLPQDKALNMLKQIAESKRNIPIPPAPGKKASGAMLKKI